MTAIGATHIYNSETETFWEDVKAIVKELKPFHYFSAIGGGDLPGKLLGYMPHKSTIFIFGALGMDFFKYKPGNFIFSQHNVSGFWLGIWLSTLNKEEMMKWFGTVVGDIGSGGEIFGSSISKTFPLDDFAKAIVASQSVASEGKVILRPQE